MTLPEYAPYVIVGAGVHGLSTAYHLAVLLRERGLGSGKDIVIVDKGDVGSGASGIACGVVRNNYFQPAMRELMAHSVSVWEEDAETYSYHPVGYMQISAESMHADVASIYEQQQAIGYESEFIEGAQDSARYMESIFSDWQAKGVTSVLHEKKGGYANNMLSMRGLWRKAESEGVRLCSGTTVTGFRAASGNSSAISAVLTDRGEIGCDQVVIGAGPWVRDFWSMLELPQTIEVLGGDGAIHREVPMWKFWQLEEGVLSVDPEIQKTNDGSMPPVIHIDTDAPLYSTVDGSLITDKLWGIYYKPDFNFNGIQGGAMPYEVTTPAEDLAIDPYGPASPEWISSPDFAVMWVSALAHCQKRFEGRMADYHKEPSGGVGCFTPDSFPVIDVFRENAWVIADSNHGYKMIGVGKLVAQEILGEKSRLLEPFRFARYTAGKLHPVSNSPYPWS